MIREEKQSELPKTKRAGLSGVKWDLLTALTNESMIKNASNIEEFIDFTLLSK